jgi:hypothetical protein
MQKLKTIKKKHIIDQTFVQRRFEVARAFWKTRKRMKQDKEFLYNITLSTTTMHRIYVVLTHDVRINNVNTFNQQKIINQIVKKNSNLHKNLNIVRVVWTKKIERLRKEHFSLIIEFVNFEMINKLIKNDLLNDYSY